MSLAEQYVAFMTILRKEIRRYLRIWPQTLLPSAITMSLYFVIELFIFLFEESDIKIFI